ncbi:glucose-1-phosphate thymidylyltransferase RfbA [Gammaproteobacteria bacterium]|nr:glucose-1-phosphate thymidylyltransferase RfbA [Gammaproteobacteria bacterium]
MYKGIILAGGSGSRLYPVTLGISKQLLPIYDKPMIYYPISILMLAGIREILLISTPQDMPNFKRLLGDGSQFGVSFEYEEQKEPRGLAEAFIIGEKFINKSPISLILGDNLFYGYSFQEILKRTVLEADGAKIFGYSVSNPQEFGVVELDEQMKVLSIEEKPQFPKSNTVVTGLYFYDNEVVEIAKNLQPSERGEIEITDINQVYLQKDKLKFQLLGRGFTWLDTGNHDSLLQASSFVQTIQTRQGLKIACLEEIALQNGWIDKEELLISLSKYGKSDYSSQIKKILNL